MSDPANLPPDLPEDPPNGRLLRALQSAHDLYELGWKANAMRIRIQDACYSDDSYDPSNTPWSRHLTAVFCREVIDGIAKIKHGAKGLISLAGIVGGRMISS